MAAGCTAVGIGIPTPPGPATPWRVRRNNMNDFLIKEGVFHLHPLLQQARIRSAQNLPCPQFSAQSTDLVD